MLFTSGTGKLSAGAAAREVLDAEGLRQRLARVGRRSEAKQLGQAGERDVRAHARLTVFASEPKLRSTVTTSSCCAIALRKQRCRVMRA